MFRLLLLSLTLLLLSTSFAATPDSAPASSPSPESTRKTAAKHLADGNFKDAYTLFSALALNPATPSPEVGQDLNNALSALQQLNRTEEIDALREKVIAAHAQDPALLHSAALSYLQTLHDGYIIAGTFNRGYNRNEDGLYANAFDRDRIRALQLMQAAHTLYAQQLQNAIPSHGQFYLDFAAILLAGRHGPNAWQLQALSDLAALPDYEEGYGRYYDEGYGYNAAPGAPVNPDGSPVLHALPQSYDAAKTDGERWRWCLKQAQTDPDHTAAITARFIFAAFLQQQFDVQTLAPDITPYAPGPNPPTPLANDPAAKPAPDPIDDSGPYLFSTLPDNETIARLATGIKRFKLTDEYNFIKLFQSIAAEPARPAEPRHEEVINNAFGALASTYQNRQQFNTAAEWWQKRIARFGKGPDNQFQKALDQIIGNWGRFDSAPTQSNDKPATLSFQFRNASKVTFQANEIDIPQLLADVKAYIKAHPRQLESDKYDINNIGYELVEKNKQKYLGKKAADWTLDLKPRPNHFTRDISLQTPLKAPGAYLVKADVADGNSSFIVLWITDTVLLQKNLGTGAYYFVADAATGQPLPKATIDSFGFRQRWLKDNDYKIDTQQLADKTDPQGQLIVPGKNDPNGSYQWLTTATSEDGARTAFLGFSNIWYSPYPDSDVYQLDHPKVFTMTDRPVYRPGQTAHYKIWINKARYDDAWKNGKSPYAGQDVKLEIYNPKNEKISEKTLTCDDFGGLNADFQIDKNATLGQYRFHLPRYDNGGTFRVEEYKKPEFEVTVDAPTEPVMLGDKITATIKATYYFGAPVTQARVKYKVTRTNYEASWFPGAPWDWFYQPGYWWFAYDYPWYPGWSDWGTPRPRGWWWGSPSPSPEIVSENTVPISPDGTVKIEIDTALAKAVHADIDHKYQISAEVTDQSRRTINGEGAVAVARKPFKVYVWVDRGYYRAGDVIHADFSAQTLANKPVTGKGTLTLFKTTYDNDGKPLENAIEKWNLDPNPEGHAQLQIKAALPGQYRLSYTVTDAQNHDIQGGYVFVIRDDAFTGNSFRFNDLEIITDKKEYAAGDTLHLMLNTNRTDATLLLFLRPNSGIYLPPKVLQLKGKSTIEDIALTQKDMPNFFIEALTISSGKIYDDVREIVVPPADRVLNVAVTPAARELRPGAKTKVQIKVTELNGEPFLGSAVVSIYDKSVEYISDGSNVPEIKAFFWKWRRSHYPATISNLDRSGYNLNNSHDTPMADLSNNFPFFLIGADDVTTQGRNGLFFKRGMLNSATDAAPGMVAGEAMAAVPAASAAPPRGLQQASQAEAALEKDKDGLAESKSLPPSAQPTTRKNFADTALWVGSLNTAPDGSAEVELTMPESLTTWRTKVWTLGSGTRVGEGQADIITNKNLIIRLQAPRFFTQKDEVLLSANVHNFLKTKKEVRVILELEGNTLQPLNAPLEQHITLEPNSEKRVDWRVLALKEGTATVRMKALTDEESDAMELPFPVYVHGILKTDSFSGFIPRAPENAPLAPQSSSLAITVPHERRPEQSTLEIRYSPSVASAMVDALPYLVDYPYGCTEQTLNRFLPTVITQHLLQTMNLDLKAIRDKRTNLNAQQIGNDPDRAKQWKHLDRNPVFDPDEVQAMVKDGVAHLTNMQLADGGWGWFSGSGEFAYPHTTALIVHGLQLAKANDVALTPGTLERGVDWLKRYQDQQVASIKDKDHGKQHADNLDAFVYMVLIDSDHANTEMLNFLYRDRTLLAVYAKSMFALALQKQKQAEKLDMLLQNISQFVVQDEENQTAYLKFPGDNYWWCWYGSEFEANAYYLKLLARTDPKGQLAARFAKYLINNRRHATWWNSTRDTAICIEALADFVKASGEDKPDLTVQILVDGKTQKEVKITAENLFSFDNKLLLAGPDLTDGPHKIEVRKTGPGPLYYCAYLTNFTLEDNIQKAGLEIKVQRKFYKLIPTDKSANTAGDRGQVVSQKVEKYTREELPNLATLKSGDLCEVELEIDSKNDYEYILFEDLKAAGFEPLELRSGYTPNALHAYMELHDERVCFFARELGRGKHSVSYRLRAEIPGLFSALPTQASAMYAPELKANADEIKLHIIDPPDPHP